MPIRIFSVRAIADDRAQQDELNEFLNGHRIVSIQKELVVAGTNSFWSICIDYLPKAGAQSESSANPKRSQVDYREILSPQDFAVFAQLREVRKAIANREGVPMYTIFTNQQLADLVTSGVSSKADFGNVKGVGTSRIEKYADEFLSAISSHQGKANETDGKPVSGDS